MNRKSKKQAGSDRGLSFRRETIRSLTDAESKQVLGGMRCTSESCLGQTCPNSVCTITVDTTL
ncbi:MAG TPA: class I lanthipeptide [Kofleriaceae bacterium]|nr:class I lanthipeptide [Kofleriaceae bacterium]